MTIWELPLIERSAPVFTNLSVSETHSETDGIRSILEAVDTHLHPQDPHHFRYGIKYHEFQLLSNTPERFLADLDNIHRYAGFGAIEDDGFLEANGADPLPLAVTAAAVWPVDLGWFYLEGDQGYGSDAYRWTFGLLLPAPLLDLSPNVGLRKSPSRGGQPGLQA
jgi:hypothetical protein